ncbi:MAG: cation transporter [Chloracidobacterium sp.]|nr:cation transporter [Chloracidobacterium sp.]MCC6824738.1 cation transporter [Acidobacteriota bacterium]MCO5334250.1 cation diffusion facilitator family transporter [Pyrinomonadaceae bacterium]
MQNKRLTRLAWLSIATAIATISLKAAAYVLTGSIGLLSDALESVINLVAAVFALWMLTIAGRPADDGHPYGHTKAEYFSGALEGSLIGMAALSIAWAAIGRMLAPQPIENISLGLVISFIASILNLIVGQLLIREGRKHRSVTLEADGKHLMTDVYTSAGVIVAVFAVGITGWLILDPLIALIVAVNILRTGYEVVSHAATGLMDAAVPPEDHAKIVSILDGFKASHGIDYHALRTRRSGTRAFVTVHILVPDDWTVQFGHHFLEQIVDDIHIAVPGSNVFTHMEPLNDPLSMQDIELK